MMNNMDLLDDLKSVLTLFDCNVEKVKRNLNDFKNYVDSVHLSLTEKWSQVSCADARIISVHDGLLSRVCKVNEQIIKLNLHINLNTAVNNLMTVKPNKYINDQHRRRNSFEIHTNLHGIEVGGVDIQPTPKASISSSGKEPQPRTLNVLQLMDLKQQPKTNKTCKASASIATPVLLPTAYIPEQLGLLPPKGGRELSSNEAYDMLSKNMSNFCVDSIVEATVMHINILENCVFVAKWGEESKPLKRLLDGQLAIEKLQQLPDFGKIFAVYDAQEKIIPRVLINARNEGGGYDAYLPDYGEHIHLNSDDVIYGLPQDIEALPAEAIRCYIKNRNVEFMRKFIYKEVRLRILENNGNDLKVELLEHNEQLNAEQKGDTGMCKEEVSRDEHSVKLTESDMAMLEHVESSTSDAVKAVLGFRPTDDKRICRHYDATTGDCFKGSNCRLVHQAFAPHGATKDKELAEALTTYESNIPRELGSISRVLVTYINSSTQIYVQFIDDTEPLVWSRDEVPVSERKFYRDPRPLDMVLALYNDSYYYRAQVMEQHDGMFTIFFVDYGNKETVSIHSLAQCNYARSLKPFRAVRCIIAGLKRTQLDSPTKEIKCMEFLKTQLLNMEFDVMLISRNQDDCCIKFLERGDEILKQMFNHGYVEPTTDFCGDREL